MTETTRTPRSGPSAREGERGDSPYFSVAIAKETTLSDLLTHLYVLVPVFDNQKHYLVGDDEMEKLLAKGEGWLGHRPENEEIARRYLKFRPSLFRQALDRLAAEEQPVEESQDRPVDQVEETLERPTSLNEQRIGSVMAAIRASGAAKVLRVIAGKRLALGRLTVVDATNVQPEARKPFVELVRQYHCLPEAIVLDMPERVCQKRNRGRPDRDFAPHVVRNQSSQLRRSLRGLRKEGVRHVFVMENPEEVEGLERFVRREPLRRVHEYVLGVLALESEPVDPRL
jgi:predicted kinase